MARLTSIKAYHEVLDSGWIAESHKELYAHLYEHGPLTSAEVFAQVYKGDKKMALTQSRARFTELRDAGLFYEKGKRKCSVTGRTVILWDVTDKFPAKKRLTKIQKLKKQLVACNAKAMKLRRQIKQLEIQDFDKRQMKLFSEKKK